MTHSLYLATNGNATGKRLVSLGLVDFITRRYNRVAFFRPIVRTTAEEDTSLQLMNSRYKLVGSLREMVGVNRNEARQLLTTQRESDLLKSIQQRFEALREQADFVVVEGTSFQGLAPEIEFELNADLAHNLGSPVVAVYTAKDYSIEECFQRVRIGNEGIRSRGAVVFATIVNQVAPESLKEFERGREALPLEDDGSVYFVPEDPLLRKPTLLDISQGIDAQFWAGDQSSVDREIRVLKVAAMQINEFLDRLVDGALIITPGDRGDIIIGCLLAAFGGETAPAGMILTGGLRPTGWIERMVTSQTLLPIFVHQSDTFSVATRASQVRAEISAISHRKITSAIGLFERSIDLDNLASRLEIPAPQRMTPLMFEHLLVRRAQQSLTTIVLPEGDDPRILRAADILRRRGVCHLILLGSRESVNQAAQQAGVDLDPSDKITKLQVIDPATSELREQFAAKYAELRSHKGITLDAALDQMSEVSYFGTMLVHYGLAGGMVSGATHTTADTVRPAFEFIKTSPGVKTVSSLFFMCLRSEVLIYGDCAIVPNPNVEQLADIASSSADTASSFGIEPRVAMLSYSTGVSGSGEDVERVRQATELVQQRRPDLLVEGPMQYDAAVDSSVAASKIPDSRVAGRATVLIFPDLNTGNNTYKAVQRTAGAVAIGPVLQGLRKPVNDLSRGCTVEDIVNTVAITAIQAAIASADGSASSHTNQG